MSSVTLLALPLFLSVYFKPCSALSSSSFLFAFLELCPITLSSMLSYPKCFCASLHHLPIPSLPLPSSPHKRCPFFLCLKWMVFLRKSAADCCRGQRAGVSPQPADLSTAAVFVLCLVPQLSLPVVLPVFLFPNSSSCSRWFLPHPVQLSFFCAAVSHSFRTWYGQRVCHRVHFFALSLLEYLTTMSCWTASGTWMWCTVYTSTPENTSEDTCGSFSTVALTLLHKLSMLAVV